MNFYDDLVMQTQMNYSRHYPIYASGSTPYQLTDKKPVPYSEQIHRLVQEVKEADCVVVGGASGLSAAGGGDFYYEDNDSYRKYFRPFAEKYHFKGAFAGMMHDLAMGSLFGFTSIWLMPCCLFVTLLVVNLIHRNILNFLWMNLTAVILVQSAELLFKYIIWRNPDIDVVLINYVLPALIATVILSAPLYLIIRQINKKLGVENNTDDILTAFEDVEDDEDKVRY